jgi:hypothetical protein
MTIQQICGALVAFFLSFYNMYLRIMKLLTGIFSKKGTCFKEVRVFLCLLAQLRKEIKMVKNKM